MKILPLLFIVALCGCRTDAPAVKNPAEPSKRTRQVKIETDPPGMRIFYGIAGNEERAMRGREYVGQSPCPLIVPCDGEGRFVNTISGFARPVAVFYAEPPFGTTNLFDQRQSFAVPAKFVRPGKIPTAVFFDMHRP